MGALVTGDPSFSAVQIQAGDRLSIFVPVNEYTRRVDVDIASLDPSEPARTAAGVDTEGDEVVELVFEDTELPAGLYLAGFILLAGAGERPPTDTFYTSKTSDAFYKLGVSRAAEDVRRCLSRVQVPTFTVVPRATP